MRVEVQEYCVLELTVIHSMSVQMAENLGICQSTGDEKWGGAQGCKQRMFHSWEYKHSTICNLKRLGWEGHGSLLRIVWTLFSLPKEVPRKLPVLCLRTVTDWSQQSWGGLASACSWVKRSAYLVGNAPEKCQLLVRPIREYF